jgi:hypothetical protein
MFINKCLPYYINFKNEVFLPALVSYTCNPSYSEDRDQEDHGLKPVQANRSGRPYLKNAHHKKRADGVA